MELQHAVQTVSKIKDIKLRTRKKEFILARALFSMVAHQNFKISKSEIGRYLNLNHASIINLIKKSNETYKTGYDVFNIWHVKLEEFYRDVYLSYLSVNRIPNLIDIIKLEIENEYKVNPTKQRTKTIIVRH